MIQLIRGKALVAAGGALAAASMAADTAFGNARRNSDLDNARIEHDRALRRVMTSIMKDDGFQR